MNIITVLPHPQTRATRDIGIEKKQTIKGLPHPQTRIDTRATIDIGIEPNL